MAAPPGGGACPFGGAAGVSAITPPWGVRPSRCPFAAAAAAASSGGEAGPVTASSGSSGSSSATAGGMRRVDSTVSTGSSAGAAHTDAAASASGASNAERGRTPGGVFQSWRLQRDATDAGAATLSRRQLRRLGRGWALSEVARHKTVGDAWIAVNGRVSRLYMFEGHVQGAGSHSCAAQNCGGRLDCGQWAGE